MHIWSSQQEVIFDEFASNGPHFGGMARAGTGKSTTMFEGIKRSRSKRTWFAAFNKKIADAGNDRNRTPDGATINPTLTIKTIHSVGAGYVYRYWKNVNIQFGQERVHDLVESVAPAAPKDTKRLIRELCTKGRELLPHASQRGDLLDLAYQFELLPDNDGSNFDLDYIEGKALDAMLLAATRPGPEGIIDGADMIYLPIRNNWLSPRFDETVVDEAQDMVPSQLEIVRRVTRRRVVFVGDNRQAIYGFRGADSQSMSRLQQELRAKVYPLTITYRCGYRIVELAQSIVPDFYAGPNNPEGEVLYRSADEMYGMVKPGDFVLSRSNAPLMSIAMKLLRHGVPTQIAGRNLGENLMFLIRRMEAEDVTDLARRIARWEQREVDKYLATMRELPEVKHANIQTKIEGIHDQATTLMNLLDNADSVDQVIDRINALFTDKNLGGVGHVLCSSVHKSKGLEADRVFVLKDTLRTGDEEDNIRYVAITRAKHSLVFVSGVR